MLRKSILTVLCLLLLGPAGSALAGLDPTLSVYWPFDEGQGTVANDLSGNGNNGTLVNNPAWVAGKLGNALRFNGSNTYVRGAYVPLNNRSFTITMWVNPVLSGSAIIFSEQQSSSQNLNMHFRLGGPSSTDAPVRGVRFGFYSNDIDTAGGLIQDNTWYHLTFWYDFAAQRRRIYINGAQVADAAATPYLGTSGNIVVGSWNGSSQFYNGMIDDVQIYQKALSVAEIQSSMKGLTDKSLAQADSPADRATDVPRDAILSWTAGEYAVTHDVYFGIAAADVNSATRTDAKGVLASRGQTAATYDPAGLLAYGQTYYWRIDEVNKPADNTIFKGEVWSFTVEPYGYPVKPVAATASSAQPSMGPEKTIDGSGLTGDLHGTEPTSMWMSAGVPPNWIQYEFDKVYKLYDLKVWNSNQLIESFLGFGAKTVKIETSVDGTTWIALADVPEFARAPGGAAYAANTTINFGGVEAKYVKLTITATWGGVAPQTGLAEVRFSYIPVQAREPQPANAATGVQIDTTLDWRPGREAASHQVFLGTDPAAVAAGTAPAKTVTDHGFDPGALNFGTTYYWRVDEVNAVTYPGEVWSFTTQEYAAVEDFESYTDDEGNRIYEAWIDGWTNGTGSVVGYLQAPFAERTIIRSGKQSMPFEYNNVKTPFYSEAERTFSVTQDWTTNGADTLALYFRGYPAGFVDKGNNAFTVSSTGNDIWGTSDQFRFVYKTLNGNGSITVRVDSLTRSDAWSKAGVMIRETLDANSKNAMIAVTPNNGVSFQWRAALAGTSAHDNANTTGLTAPYWVRITRTGNVFKAERSADGQTWVQQGVDTTIAMPTTVYIGLAVTSHNVNAYSTAEFSNVATTGGVTGSWQNLSIGVTQRANDPAPLYLTVEDRTGKKKTVIHPNSDVTTLATWTEWRIPLSDLTGVNLAAVKKVTLGVGDRTAPKAGPAGILFIDDIQFGHPVP